MSSNDITNEDVPTNISTDKNDPPNVDIFANNQQELNEETLGEVMRDFGQHVASRMNEEMDKLLKDFEYGDDYKKKRDEQENLIVDNKRTSEHSGRIDSIELEKFRDIQHSIAKNTQTRIELVGKKNDGQITQSWFTSGAAGQPSFLTNVNKHLQSAGAFISNQLNSLSNLVPRINGKMRTIPARIRPLLRWPSFLEFKIKFNKVYKSVREEIYRQMIFLNRQVICGIQNVKYLFGRRTHLLKATEFSDITGKEYQEIYDNKEAEREDPLTKDKQVLDQFASLDENLKDKLKLLVKENKNIFGKSMQQVIERTLSRNLLIKQKILEDENKIISLPSSPSRRRKKRSSSSEDVEMVDSHNELDDEEDDEYNEGTVSELEELEGDNGDDDDADDDEDKSEFFVDEFAAEFYENADTSKADELEGIMDEALNNGQPKLDDDFKPIDLRETGCIITPENQDRCGCCYAHVTAAAASYYNCMQNNFEKPQRYNARFTSDCGRYLTPDGVRPKVDGCSGGKLSSAIAFTKLAGTHIFMDYEVARVSYDFKSDKCAFPRPESIEKWAPIEVPFFAHTKFTNLKLSDVDLHLRAIGPVFVNLRTWKDFIYHGKGIYGKFEESENPTIHSMLIVGHDRDSHGRDYWILWNSHGTAWAEQGFVRVYSESLEFFKVYLGGLLTSEMLDEMIKAQGYGQTKMDMS